MNNYNYLRTLKEPKLLIVFIISMLMIILMVLSYFIKTYDNYSTYGVYDNQLLKVDIMIDYSDILNDNKLKINDKLYTYEIINVSEILENNDINYQEYYLKINDLNLYQNEVVKINFYYKYERLINKIIRLIF